MKPEASRVIVLMYHRVGDVSGPDESRYAITGSRFGEHMAALSRAGYRAVPIDALVDWLHGGAALKEGDFVITFDDGFQGVLNYATPILQALNWPYTVFLVSDRIGLDENWKRNQNKTGRRHQLLNLDEICSMIRTGCSFHSHTRSHTDLRLLGSTDLAAELMGSRASLKEILGQAPDYLAYPYGLHDERIIAAARDAGYKAGFSVQPGFNKIGLDPFRLRRLDIFGTDTAKALIRKVRLGSNDGSFRQSMRYYGARLASRLGVAAK